MRSPSSVDGGDGSINGGAREQTDDAVVGDADQEELFAGEETGPVILGFIPERGPLLLLQVGDEGFHGEQLLGVEGAQNGPEVADEGQQIEEQGDGKVL